MLSCSTTSHSYPILETKYQIFHKQVQKLFKKISQDCKIGQCKTSTKPLKKVTLEVILHFMKNRVFKFMVSSHI